MMYVYANWSARSFPIRAIWISEIGVKLGFVQKKKISNLRDRNASPTPNRLSIQIVPVP